MEVKSSASFYRHPKLSDGRRPECKDCSKLSKEKRKEEFPLEHVIKSMASGILKRVIWDIDKPKNKCYKENNVKCRLGNTIPEVYEVLSKHYRDDIKRLIRLGKKPSVDRIDSTGDYELGNIRIIDLKENISKGSKESVSIPIRVIYPDGCIKDFKSIIEASRELKCKRDTIYASLEKPGINRKGLLFEIIKNESEAV